MEYIAIIDLTFDNVVTTLHLLPGLDEAEITEEAILWCSANGYSYDDCDWEYE